MNQHNYVCTTFVTTTCTTKDDAWLAMFHAISKSLLSRSSPRPFSILAAVRFVASRLTLSLSLSFSFVGRSEKNHDDHTTNDGKWLLAGEMDPYAGILRHPSGETAMRGRRDPPATFSAFKAALQCHFPLGPRITQRRADGFSVSFPRVFPRLFSHFDIYIYIYCQNSRSRRT